jgi:hypothetical protein
MVRPRGIEPLSTVLQTVAMTTSAKDANDTLLITLYAECHGDIGTSCQTRTDILPLVRRALEPLSYRGIILRIPQQHR